MDDLTIEKLIDAAKLLKQQLDQRGEARQPTVLPPRLYDLVKEQGHNMSAYIRGYDNLPTPPRYKVGIPTFPPSE
jgi:hypothetical protein